MPLTNRLKDSPRWNALWDEEAVKIFPDRSGISWTPGTTISHSVLVLLFKRSKLCCLSSAHMAQCWTNWTRALQSKHDNVGYCLTKVVSFMRSFDLKLNTIC